MFRELLEFGLLRHALVLPGKLQNWGTKRPWHFPKHWCSTLKLASLSFSRPWVNSLPLGSTGNAAPGRSRALHNRCASVSVMRPQEGALNGRMPSTLRMCSCSASHREQ
ncbi:hypothetical protein EYF80_031717 [Liparis tanakae]|uniref:Uncharacterized protein n=1 Tax=Liparis tanakae TaxID=230148 RepID=A0A4Z2GY61_9TELE|nr:hypothetical protein EYF80_031717 [Liparis tanakae]